MWIHVFELMYFLTATTASVKITDFPESPTNVTLGQRAVLKCTALATSGMGYIQWMHNTVTFSPITEDPFCLSNVSTARHVTINNHLSYLFFLPIKCSTDPQPASVIAKQQRVRMYTVYSTTRAYCNTKALIMQSYLIINNVSSEDAGNYICTAQTAYVYSTQSINQSASLFLYAGIAPCLVKSIMLIVHACFFMRTVQQTTPPASSAVPNSSTWTQATPTPYPKR